MNSDEGLHCEDHGKGKELKITVRSVEEVNKEKNKSTQLFVLQK